MPETLSPDQVLDAVENWTLLQINDFVKKFEEKFDVSAAAPYCTPAGSGVSSAVVRADRPTWAADPYHMTTT
jgi:large subunit ribosomal protein L7/L12